jgi:hypothetical protein
MVDLWELAEQRKLYNDTGCTASQADLEAHSVHSFSCDVCTAR